jgi:hypothetical protein
MSGKKPATVHRHQPRTENRFREREVARVMRAVKASGMPVKEIIVDPKTGRIAVVVDDRDPTSNDLDTWMAKREKNARPA